MKVIEILIEDEILDLRCQTHIHFYTVCLKVHNILFHKRKPTIYKMVSVLNIRYAIFLYYLIHIKKLKNVNLYFVVTICQRFETNQSYNENWLSKVLKLNCLTHLPNKIMVHITMLCIELFSNDEYKFRLG